MASSDLDRVYLYHDGTKHHFDRFARSLGYLDWASQPRPFRSYIGAPTVAFPRAARSSLGGEASAAYGQLFTPSGLRPLPVTAETIGDMLRHALGLSAWKVAGRSRWVLRVNPSSGNLHPTEAYIVTGPLPGLSPLAGVWHYAPDAHALEQRCEHAPEAWPFDETEQGAHVFLVALTSIHWRESWKYGERGFRYCQHDLGHAIGALALAAAACGWQLTMQPQCSQERLAAMIGLDRDDDYVEAEREEPGCLLLVSPGPPPAVNGQHHELTEAARHGRWFGRGSQLSEDHVQWTFIDDIAAATRDPGHTAAARNQAGWPAGVRTRPMDLPNGPGRIDARRLMLQRRSAVALDGLSWIDRASFLSVCARAMPAAGAPWSALWWTPRVHLAIFVHRVTGLEPGLYMLVRDRSALSRMAAALDRRFEWHAEHDDLPLYRLAAGEYRVRASRLSCDQAIAADGFFSLGMIADFDRSLTDHGPSFYRHLFWEAGAIGQVLYLEAEAIGARGTGIGCFYDDAVHDVLGLADHAFQSLYHFTVGMPVEDSRLSTEPGYAWEQ
jgi:SagB-type dehydrogenase family enzyme